MRRAVVAASAFMAVIALGRASAGKEASLAVRYVGAEACGECHERQLASWRKTLHAGASARLRDDARRRRCQGCHTTGDAPAGRPAFANVGCEACHGPGAAYAADDIMRDQTLAAALGLNDLSTVEARAAVCARCHRSDLRLSPFEAETAWQRIAHEN